MEALHRLSGARFELFTSSPRWFYDESVQGLYRYYEVVTDVGFRQRSALVHDVGATAEALSALVPFDDELVDGLALEVKRAECRAVLCDIAPLGIAVAERAGLPSVLVENFTWPWLYEPHFEEAPALVAISRELEDWFRRATVHVQTEPLCLRDEGTDLHVPPIGRRVRRSREDVRAAMGVAVNAPMVVLTMGGMPEDLPFLERLGVWPGITFVVTGVDRTGVEGNVHAFDNATRIYMPDLVHAADGVVAKLGYSTIAEVWREGRPMAYVTREDSRETEPVREWVQREMTGFEIPGRDFAGGAWIGRIPDLLALPSGARDGEVREGGADAVARVVLELLRG